VRIWVDAQLPPDLARFLGKRFGIEAAHVLELGLAGAKDEAIFRAARVAGALVITKDADFVQLLERHGPPPRILWLTVGNVRNVELTRILERRWEKICAHFESGEPLVELGRGSPEV
jgi:predicted nuclease of predicted toxin-antitoxin system